MLSAIGDAIITSPKYLLFTFDSCETRITLKIDAWNHHGEDKKGRPKKGQKTRNVIIYPVNIIFFSITKVKAR
jgi:hypothetical protein